MPATEPIIKIFADADYNRAVAIAVAELIIARLGTAGVSSCSLSLSGGSTPGGVYKELALLDEVGGKQIQWQNVKLFLGDERWVNETDPQSNARMVRETLLAAGSKVLPAKFFPPDTTLDCATGAVRYADQFVKELGPKAIFDVMLLGVGDDGHTVSIFPHSELLHSNPDLCAVARHPQNHSTRITVSRTVLERARETVFLAKGSGKTDVIKRILNTDSATTETEEILPVLMFKSFSGKVRFLLDKSAAAGLAA